MSLIRVSGPQALYISAKIAPFLPARPENRRAYLGFLNYKGEDLDQSLVTYFAPGRSFTGEETLEISCHGGGVWRDVFRALLDAGARPAEKGEFSLRAFANGKMDLAQAEGLFQLIESSGREARRQALSQLKGRLSVSLQKLEEALLAFLSRTEAEIDFSHEVSDWPQEERERSLQRLRTELSTLLSRYRPFEKLEEGLSFALFGRTNSGKSSLFNALLDEDRAVVSREEGTTRDVLEGRISNPKGLNLLLKDSAGFREASHSEAEILGQNKSLKLLDSCDYRLLLLDASAKSGWDFPAGFFHKKTKSLLVFTKKDLVRGKYVGDMLTAFQKKQPAPLPPRDCVFFVSALKGEGISALKKKMLSLGERDSEDFLIGNSRHYTALKSAREALDSCFSILKKGGDERDIMALELRRALSSLHEISGRELESRVLDQIFQSFCIGK